MKNWIKFNGNACPVHPDTIVEVKFGNFLCNPKKAQLLNWINGTISEYRVQGEEIPIIKEKENFKNYW